MSDSSITFHVIDDAVVILRANGVFKQVKAFQRAGIVYAQYGAGYIRLMENGTSAPKISVDAFDLGFVPEYADFGYMVVPGYRSNTRRGK